MGDSLYADVAFYSVVASIPRGTNVQLEVDRHCILLDANIHTRKVIQ